VIPRHVRLYRAFWRNCLRQAVEFRVNFWANVLTNIGWLLSLVFFVKLIYLNTQSVAGWSEAEMFLLVGTYSLLHGVTDTLFSKNLSDLPNQIRLGTMDFTLLRPVNSQFFVSLRFVSLENLGQFVGALALLAYGLSLRQTVVPLRDVLAYVALLICGIVLSYAMSLAAMTLSFWLVRMDNLFVGLETVFSIARTPIDVFRVWGPLPRFFLTYILPLAFLAAMPTRALFGHLHQGRTLAIGAGLAVLFFALSAAFWRYATRSYSSASS
jgi:ABC-2 type transport system permease protein